MKLLHIDSAITGDHSISRQLTAQAVAAWKASHPGTQVEYLDLAQDTPPHLSAQALALREGQNAATETQRQENALTEKLLSQFLAADVIVLGAPLYNFTIPTQLKAWIDRIAQAGRTFTYTEQGPQGLAGGKTVIAVMTRGSVHPGTEASRSTEHQQTYLQTVFNFLGITDVRFVHAEGLAMGPDAKARGLSTAETEIRAHTAVAANQEQVARVA